MAFDWSQYQKPNVTMNTTNGGVNDTRAFFRPDNSVLPMNGDLTNYLTGGGTLDANGITNRTVKMDGALTREQMGNQTSFLNDQMGTGFGGIQTSLDQMAQYGGAFGDKNSPVYSPQSKNGYGSAWGNNNPFKIGSF